MLETRRRVYEFRAKSEPGADGRTRISGYASMFGQRNSFGEVFVPGAFRDDLLQRSGPLVMGWQHTDVIGRWDVPPSGENENGLFLDGPISKTRAGEDAAILVRDGAVNGLSIGFNPAQDGYRFAKRGQKMQFDTPYGQRSYQFDDPTVYITRAAVPETSIVISPADDNARILQVRSKAARALPGMSPDGSADDAKFSMALLLGARGTPAFADAPPSERAAMYEQVAALYERHSLTPPEFDLDPDYAAVEFQHDEREVYAKRTIARRITDLSDALRLAGRVEDHELLARADEAALELKRFADQANRRSAREALHSGLRASLDSLKEAPRGR